MGIFDKCHCGSKVRDLRKHFQQHERGHLHCNTWRFHIFHFLQCYAIAMGSNDFTSESHLSSCAGYDVLPQYPHGILDVVWLQGVAWQQCVVQSRCSGVQIVFGVVQCGVRIVQCGAGVTIGLIDQITCLRRTPLACCGQCQTLRRHTTTCFEIQRWIQCGLMQKSMSRDIFQNITWTKIFFRILQNNKPSVIGSNVAIGGQLRSSGTTAPL